MFQVKKINNLKAWIISAIFFIAIIMWTLWQFRFNYMISMYDSFFHAERIYEIRQAFAQNTLPAWINYNTFFHTGQSINGMYPDFTLYPFVRLTNFLTPIHQIIAIRSLIIMVTYVVSYLTLEKHFDSTNAALSATIFVLSGGILKDLINEMQTGTSLVMIVSFPLAFCLKDIIESKQIDYKLMLEVALLMTFVANSHLLSIISLSIVIGICLVINLVFKRNYKAIVNLGLAAVGTIVLSAPIIYRVIVISKTGLNAPFSQGRIESHSLLNFLAGAAWNAKNSISYLAILLIVVTIIFINKNQFKNITPWLLAETLLVILCTNIVPWSWFNSVPIINNFQNASWRFALYLSVIPIIIFLMNFGNKRARLILICLTVLSYGMSFQAAYNAQYQYTSGFPILNEYSTDDIPKEGVAKLTSTGINSDRIKRTLVPDYSPASVAVKDNSNGFSFSDRNVALLSNHLAIVNGKEIPLNYSGDAYSTKLTGNNFPNGTVTLPYFHYKSLKYKIMVNDEPVKIASESNGLVQINNKTDLKAVTFEIHQVLPIGYLMITVVAVLLYLLGLFVVFRYE